MKFKIGQQVLCNYYDQWFVGHIYEYEKETDSYWIEYESYYTISDYEMCVCKLHKSQIQSID